MMLDYILVYLDNLVYAVHKKAVHKNKNWID